MRFDAVLWDVDGTLLDFVYSQRHAVTKCFQSIGREVSDEILQRYKDINDSYWKKLELGEVTKQQLLTGRFVDLFEEYGITDVDVDKFVREYQEQLGRVYKYTENSLDICKALKGNIRQYVITNGVTSTQENKLKISGFYDLMDGIFISEQIGSPKPQREFFEHCLKIIGNLPKDRMLIVGDSLTSDIKGGKLCGIPTCWYRPEGIHEGETAVYESFRPDFEISSLSQIFDILNRV